MKRVYESFYIGQFWFIVEQEPDTRFSVRVVDTINNKDNEEFWLVHNREDRWHSPSGWRAAILDFCQKKVFERRKNEFTITEDFSNPY